MADNLSAERRSNNRFPVDAEFRESECSDLRLRTIHNARTQIAEVATTRCERRSIHQRETQLLLALDCSHCEWLLDWFHR